jgi:hypothetical protein
MKNTFYKLIVRGLIVKKYSDLKLRDLFWDYEVNEHADKFLIEVEDLISTDRVAIRIKIPRHEAERSFLETAAMLLDNLETALNWYIKEDKT